MDTSGRPQSGALLSTRQKALHQFTQQSLPACTPTWVITSFFFVGVIVIPIGLAALRASQTVVEIVERYDNECIPEPFRGNKVAYIKDESSPKICTRFLKGNVAVIRVKAGHRQIESEAYIAAKTQKKKDMLIANSLNVPSMARLGKDVLSLTETVKGLVQINPDDIQYGSLSTVHPLVELANTLCTPNCDRIRILDPSAKPDKTKDSRKYTGIVEDCCCDYETVDGFNEEVLNPFLQELVTTPFFRYFKAKLWCDCPFWLDDGMCRLRDCSVCECPQNEFPEPFKKPFQHKLSSDDLICQEGKPQAAVDRTLDSKAFRGWIDVDNPWTYDDETDNAELTYVNLQLNPERYTGYVGPSARRIWDAVYTENCPKYPFGEFCQEKRVLYKLISGLHSSISVHIAAEYLLDEAKNLWGQNLELLDERVLRYPERVRNLYFTFLFVLRAVTKAANYLEHAEYNTGNPVEDLKTQSLIKQLLYNPKLQAACPLPFDEAKLWQGQSGPELKQQTQKQFRNISALMDCVGCEKCRLWEKLQVLGLGTALKILFSVDGQNNIGQPLQLQLQRNEVIALLNILNRLSESVKFVHEMGPTVEKSRTGRVSAPSNPSST